MTIDSGQKIDLQMVKQSCLGVSSSISMAVLTAEARFWTNDKKEKKLRTKNLNIAEISGFPSNSLLETWESSFRLHEHKARAQDPSTRQQSNQKQDDCARGRFNFISSKQYKLTNFLFFFTPVKYSSIKLTGISDQITFTRLSMLFLISNIVYFFIILVLNFIQSHSCNFVKVSL